MIGGSGLDMQRSLNQLRTMDDARHATAIGMSLYPGLKAVLDGRPLDTNMLDRYVGRFKFPQGDLLSITREGQMLVAAWNGEESLKLAVSTPSAQGTVESVVLHRDGQSFTGIRELK